MFARCAAHGTGPSISIFDPSFLRVALTLHRHGRVPPGAIVKLYFGGALEFGLPPTTTALEAYLEMLEPSGLPWSVAVLGGDVVACGLAETAVRRGGHVRVGLEDYAGSSTPTNTELVDGAVALLADLGHRPATIAETRGILGSVNAVVDRLRAAGCVFAEEEAALLLAATGRRRGAGGAACGGRATGAGARVGGVRGPARARRARGVRAAAAQRVPAWRRRWRCPGRSSVDACCGSGAIGAALLAARPSLVLHATDVDPAAVACARENLPGAGAASTSAISWTPCRSRSPGGST